MGDLGYNNGMASRQNITRRLQLSVLGIACVTAAFALGIQSAGDVRTIAALVAGNPLGDGDFTADGIVDTEDVVRVLEIVRGYTEATPEDFRADPNGDGLITIDDALTLLHSIAHR